MEENEERIRELEAKIKRLEEKLKEEKGEEEAEGIAGGLLREIGGMFGLGGLIKGLEKSSAFKERLKAIDDEVERRLREEPLKRVGEERSRHPYISRSFSVRTPAEEEPAFEVKPAVMKRVPKAKWGEAVKEPTMDIFDEGDHLKVIVELPGVEEKDIKIDLTGDNLSISADTPYRKYHREVTLPGQPKGAMKTAYKNGILEIRLEKG
ncbi:MAG: Hsp20/alpha crystallin family protein [Dehalococcoidales bacterium]|nr:Hsp20/alpha crystallin family protein [Dehalococcoidales bacterium]